MTGHGGAGEVLGWLHGAMGLAGCGGVPVRGW